MKLRKSRNRILAGVCAGIAEWLEWPARLIRFLFFTAAVFGLGIGGLVVYTILALVMPPPAEGFDLQKYRKQ